MLHRALASLAALLSVLALAVVAGGCSKHAAPSRSASPGSSADLGTSGGFGPPPPSHAGTPPASAPTFADSGAVRAEETEASIAGRVPSRDRLGLGTAFGEHRHSHVVTAPFQRDSGSPELVLSMRYDDFVGVDTAARRIGGGSPLESRFGAADGSFVVSLLDDTGHPLPAAEVGGTLWAVGDPGQRYMIGVENRSAERWEVVTSVDGLDVIDGEPAGLHKRGYIVDPWSTITIEGWRTSESGVAAFRFSALEDSYAGRKGEARNVGVVGVAFFRERGAGRHWDDTARRHAADPFPGRFADPPP